MKKYGLREKKSQKILEFSITSNEGSAFCYSYEVSIDSSGLGIWMVDTFKEADYVRRKSTEWYNACFETPSHDYEADELEVIEIIMEIKGDL